MKNIQTKRNKLGYEMMLLPFLESFKKLYKSRAPVIEGIFGEAKEWHGLRRAWRRGLSKMLVQSLLIATVLNYKRLATALYVLNTIKITFRTGINAILNVVEQLRYKIFDVSKFDKKTARLT